MRVGVEAARPYFAHPSQQVMGITPETLPGEPFEYWAEGPLCIVAHQVPHPGLWMVHFAAKPEGRGRLIEPAKRLLHEIWADKQPKRLIGWTPVRFRAACAAIRRVGFVTDGILPLPDGDVVMSGWRPEDGY